MGLREKDLSKTSCPSQEGGWEERPHDPARPIEDSAWDLTAALLACFGTSLLAFYGVKKAWDIVGLLQGSKGLSLENSEEKGPKKLEMSRKMTIFQVF